MLNVVEGDSFEYWIFFTYPNLSACIGTKFISEEIINNFLSAKKCISKCLVLKGWNFVIIIKISFWLLYIKSIIIIQCLQMEHRRRNIKRNVFEYCWWKKWNMSFDVRLKRIAHLRGGKKDRYAVLYYRGKKMFVFSQLFYFILWSVCQYFLKVLIFLGDPIWFYNFIFLNMNAAQDSSLRTP